MNIDMIVSKINLALEEERSTGGYAQMVRNMGEENGQLKVLGKKKFEAGVKEVIDWTVEYIRHVPAILQAARAVAGSVGMAQDLEPVLRKAEDYWDRVDDVIPDRLGLVGILDDAYFSLWMIEDFSRQFQDRTGKPLLSVDLSVANRSARQIIGDEFATKIEQYVHQQMGNAAMMQILQALARYKTTLNTPDPIWGNASVDDIVRTRLGMIGIF